MSENRSIRKKITASVIAGVLALTLVTSGCGIFNKEKSETATNNNSGLDIKNTDEANVIVAKSKNYSINLPIASYLFNSYYQNYRDYAVYQGLDVTKSLKDQAYSDDMTWFDYFMTMTKQYLQQLLGLCEAAKENQVVLEQSDLDTVETTMNSIKDSAANAGVELDKYIVTNFGGNVTEESLRDYLKLTALAQKYYQKLYKSFSYTDEELENYYKENPTSYQYADFMHFSFSYADSEGQADESDPETEKRKKEAKAFADELVEVKTEKEFTDWITKYLTEHPELVSESADNILSGDELKTAVEKQVESSHYNKYAYEVTSAAGKWIFDLSRNKLDTTIVENTSSYTVFLLLKPAYRDETISKNVRHILFTAEKYGGSDDAALSEATKVYKAWKEGNKTEESFAALVEEYTADSGSKYNGGLYEDVKEGDMVTEFNDWLFDSSRKPGDTGFVKTKYGYHIMYFVGDGDPAWKISIESVMRKTDLDNALTELVEKYKVDIDEDAASTIEESETIQEESSIAEISNAVTSQTETSQTETSQTETSSQSESSQSESSQSETSQTANSKDETASSEAVTSSAEKTTSEESKS